MLDSNQRRAPSNVVIDAAINNSMKSVYTGIPGYVIAFDPVTQRAQVQIGIIRVNMDGSTFNVPPIVDVPVQFPGDKFTLEYEINPGCEGYIHFSQRCLDGWKQTGGIADNPVARFHNKQDAFFSPGGRSLPNKITDFANNGIRLRDKSGGQTVWLKNDGSCIMNNSNGFIMLLANGDVNINGVVIKAQSGDTTIPNSLVLNGKEIREHTHSGVERGGDNTGPNQ